MRTTFDYLIKEHNTTLKSLARRYRWLDTEEDLYQELLCSVANSLERYTGNMCNMNSLVTLLAKRHIRIMCRVFYKNQHVVFDDSAVESALSSGVVLEEYEIDTRLFMLEIAELDGILKQYVAYLMGDSELKMNRTVASRCKKSLATRFKKYDHNQVCSEIRA